MSELTSGETTPDVPVPTDGQTPATGEAPQTPVKPVSLFESKEFREYQATQDRRVSQAAQENAELKKRLRDLETRDLPEVERLKYELQERDNVLAQLAAEAQQREQQAQVEELKKKDLTRLHKMSGIPMADLAEAGNYDEAMDMAVKYVESGKGREESGADETYIPSNRPSTPTTRQQQAMKDALKKGDGIGYLEHLIGG